MNPLPHIEEKNIISMKNKYELWDYRGEGDMPAWCCVWKIDKDGKPLTTEKQALQALEYWGKDRPEMRVERARR